MEKPDTQRTIHDFEEELLKISMKELNPLFVNYDTRNNHNINYDYVIRLTLTQIAVSPQQINETSHREEKEVGDGFSYKIDTKGNVMKPTCIAKHNRACELSEAKHG